MNRAERRRHGLTRSRMARTGSLASAGVLMSVGLFGAYTGSPRLQRAYAMTCSPSSNGIVYDDTTLRHALDDSTVTCIEITNSFQLTGQLNPIDEQDWVGSAREDDGLTILGSGDDTIDGAGNFGIQLTLNDPNNPLTKPAKLSISDLNFTNFTGNNGTAVYAYLYGQPQDLFLTMDRVNFSHGSSNFIGGAVYAKATTSSAYIDITNASFANNTAYTGGAIYVLADDTAALDISASTFTNNSVVKDSQSQRGQGGAIWMSATGRSQVFIDSATKFEGNTAEDSGGAVFSLADGDASATISGNAEFTGNMSGGTGGAVSVRSNQGDVDVSVSAGDFTDNQALWGGAVYTYGYDSALTTINSSTFTRNIVLDPQGGLVDGGAVFTDSYRSATVDIGPDTHFNDNDASGRGGAIHAGWLGNTIGTVNVDEGVSFNGNTAGSKGGAIFAQGAVDISGSATAPVLVSANQATGSGGAIYAAGDVTIGEGASFDRNMATGVPGNGGAVFTASSLTVSGSQAHPVAFRDDSAAGSGGALFARNGGTVTSAILERNTAKYGGAAYSTDNGWSFTDSTIRDNDVLAWGAGVYSMTGPVAFYRSAIVGNDAAGGAPGGVIAWGGPMIVENSFIGGNSAVGDPGGGIWTDGDLHLRASTVYDNSTSRGATEIAARNITSTMSVVGNSSRDADIWDVAGTLDDTNSVSTATEDDSQFDTNLTAGTLAFGNLTGTLPGELGRTPDVDSPLALGVGIPGGFAPLTNPLPGITIDQTGQPRLAPFTIGARQAPAAAPTVTSLSPSSGSTEGGDQVTIHGTGFIAATSASIGGTAISNFAVVDDTTITGTSPAGSAGGAAVAVTNSGGTGSLPNGFTFVDPAPPNPPAPTPATRASAPRDVRVDARVESATAAWLPPTSTGSFPVTSYQAVASPGGQTCMVAAPALTCTITGLTPGKPYTVTARALTGAGWSDASSPSSVVVPLGPEVPTILITNSRDRAQKSMARIEGTTTGLVGAEVVPYLRIAGQTDFNPGTSTRTVDAQGNFVWQRKAKKRFTVYFVSGDVTSNRLVIRPE